MKCINCGAEVADNAKFCTECGQKIERQKYCPECGAEVNGGKFCPECGAPLTAERTQRAGNQDIFEEDKQLEELAKGFDDLVARKREKDGNAPVTKTKVCYKCGGSGKVKCKQENMFSIFGYQGSETVCPECGGSGKIIFNIDAVKKAENLVIEAEKYYNNKEYSKMYELASQALNADGNNFKAQNLMGECYEFGYGVKQNYEEAVKWYRKAAEQGYDGAQYNLGCCYYFNRGVTQSNAFFGFDQLPSMSGFGKNLNYEEAVKWFRKAAEQGHAKAQHNLGACYYNGYGVSCNYDEAVNWFLKAAKQGEPNAQCALGSYYEERDYQEAIKWYRKAAEQGNNAAIENLKKLGFWG